MGSGGTETCVGAGVKANRPGIEWRDVTYGKTDRTG